MASNNKEMAEKMRQLAAALESAAKQFDNDECFMGSVEAASVLDELEALAENGDI